VATRLAQEANCEVNIAAGGVLFASSLPTADRAALVSRVASDDFRAEAQSRASGASDYVVGTFPLSSNNSDSRGPSRPAAELATDCGVRRRDPPQVARHGAPPFSAIALAAASCSPPDEPATADLARAATDIAGGNWERQVPLSEASEATMTADAFNAMTTSLPIWHEGAKKRDDALRQAQKLEALGAWPGASRTTSTISDGDEGLRGAALQSMDSDPRQEEVQEIINAPIARRR